MPDHKKSLPTYACVLLAALFFAGGIYALNEISLYTPDSTRYLVWAQSLASGDGYRDVTTPDPTRYVVHAPLYALGLAPVAWFAPGSILAAKTATLVTGVLLLLLAFGWFSHSVGRRIALLGCLVLALNPLLFLYSTEVLSDVPFAVSLVLSWVLIEKICAAPGFRPGAAIAAACSVAAALLLREIGVSVLLSALAYLLLRRRYREAVILFAIPAVLYAGWYIRNELLVAPLEDPPLTNAKIFTYHFMTGREASLVQEFSARIANNVGIYARFVGDLLFAPVQYSMQYDVIPSSDPLMASMMWALGFLRYPLALFGIASALAGVRADLRRSSSALLRISFLVFYGAVMLTYPINDIRFLLPMLLLLVYYCLVWWHSIGEEGGARLFPRAKPIIVAIVLACLVPNLSWDVVFARTSARSMQGAGAGMAEEQTDPAAPAHFTKAFRNAGSWIAAHADSDAVIMTQWKDLALWAGGRKVLNVDQTLSLDEFESQLRDYRVAILVSQVKKSGLTEFLIPMHQSRRYAFPLLQRLGNTEIYGVSARPVGARDLPADASSFERGLTSLERGEYHSADSTLSGLWFDNRQNVAALYMLAVSKACAMELGASDSLFRLLRTYPQAGIYLTRASMHEQLLAALATLDETPPGAERAERIAGIATGYWNAGLRFRSRELIGEALREDSASIGAMVFGFHFAFKEGDLEEAKELSLRFEQAAPRHPLVHPFKTILEMNDSILLAAPGLQRGALHGRLGRAFHAIGLQEESIDHLLQALEGGVDDPDVSLLLADIYVAKRRPAPARKVLDALLAQHPNSAEARSRLESPYLQP